MKPDNERKGIDSPRNGRRVFWIVCAICTALALSDLFYHKHVHYGWEGWFAFYGLYGFVSCVALVLAARELRKFVIRREDYYDR
jgi:hypothetical protein